MENPGTSGPPLSTLERGRGVRRMHQGLGQLKIRAGYFIYFTSVGVSISRGVNLAPEPLTPPHYAYPAPRTVSNCFCIRGPILS